MSDKEEIRTTNPWGTCPDRCGAKDGVQEVIYENGAIDIRCRKCETTKRVVKAGTIRRE